MEEGIITTCWKLLGNVKSHIIAFWDLISST